MNIRSLLTIALVATTTASNAIGWAGTERSASMSKNLEDPVPDAALSNLYVIRPKGHDVQAEAIKSQTPLSVKFEPAEPQFLESGIVRFSGKLSNSANAEVGVIVMADGTPLLAQPELINGVTYAPSAIRPPSPPAPHEIRIPGKKSVQISMSFDPAELIYKGAPTLTFNWQVLYWNEPRPKGKWKVTLPNR